MTKHHRRDGEGGPRIERYNYGGVSSHGPGLVGIAGLALVIAIFTPLPFFGTFLAGMFASWALRGATWAWIPAALFGFAALNNSGAEFAGASLPVLFIIAGVLVMFRDHIWDPAWKIGMLVVGFLILAAIFGGDDRRDRDQSIDVVRRPPVSESATVPDLTGKDVIVRTNSANVTLTSGSARGLDTAVRWSVEGDRVFVSGSGSGRDLVLALPDSVASISIATDEGDVDVHGAWKSLSIQTDEGAVDVVWNGAPTVDITTNDGDIDLSGFGEDDPEGKFHAEGPDGRLEITTDEGDIDVSREERAPVTTTTETTVLR